jgi:hypothetical protein
MSERWQRTSIRRACQQRAATPYCTRANYCSSVPADDLSRSASLRLRCVKRAAHPATTAIQQMRVDHRCADVSMAEKFLNGTNVVAGIEKVGGEGMPKRMNAAGLDDFCAPNRLFQSSLHDLGSGMMTAFHTAARIGRASG